MSVFKEKNKNSDKALTAVLTRVLREEAKVWADCTNQLPPFQQDQNQDIQAAGFLKPWIGWTRQR